MQCEGREILSDVYPTVPPFSSLRDAASHSFIKKTGFA